MTPEQLQTRLSVIEDAIGQVFRRLLVVEGRAFAAEQVLFGLAGAMGTNPNARYAVRTSLERARVTALNSTEPEFKVSATEELSVAIMGIMDSMAADLGDDPKKSFDNP